MANLTASSSSSKGITATIGPKISSRARRQPGPAGATTVGGNQNPGRSGTTPTATGRPPLLLVRPYPVRGSSPPSSVVGGDQWPHPSGRVGRISHPPGLDGICQQREEVIEHRALHDDTAARAAVLTCIGEYPARGGGGCPLQIGVGEDHRRRLPSSSRVTRLIVPDALAMTSRPTAVEPVKATLATSGCSTSRVPAVGPFPTTTWKTPSGRPASSASSTSRTAVNGVSSAGFTTMVLPVASAGPTFHEVMAIGKFHGTMAATTPSGSWKVMSTPPATGTVAPRCLSTARRRNRRPLPPWPPRRGSR